ncbi:eCIS core domain-containing protein [Roseateles sp. DB2]|uniref:eCIS core domain-containing protein n=1 Tax=Roseateles sp. DB2 TaxID=3453717 RepID=UPI003EEA9729
MSSSREKAARQTNASIGPAAAIDRTEAVPTERSASTGRAAQWHSSPRTVAQRQQIASFLGKHPSPLPQGQAAESHASPDIMQPAAASPLEPTNRTGLPDQLKAGLESMSSLSLDAVRVHRSSPEPARLQARAFARGTDIHLGPGQEASLPHEAWHVVQQMTGRVQPTASAGGVAINDDASLEREADVMGALALQQPATPAPSAAPDARPRGDRMQFDRKNRKKERKKNRKQRALEKRRHGLRDVDVDEQAFFDEYQPETQRPVVLEVGAGEGDFSLTFKDEFADSEELDKRSHRHDYLATDVASEPGDTNYLTSAQADDIDVRYGVDANRLHQHFRAESTDVVIGANPYGERGVPFASYGLMREVGRHSVSESGELIQDRVPDTRFLESARVILKPGGCVIVRGRSNVLRRYLTEENKGAHLLSQVPNLKKINPYLNIDPGELFVLALVGFNVLVQSATPPAINRRGTGAPDTSERGQTNLGDYNTEFRFIKTDKAPSVSFVVGGQTFTHPLGSGKRSRKNARNAPTAERSRRAQSSKPSKAQKRQTLRRQIREEVTQGRFFGPFTAVAMPPVVQRDLDPESLGELQKLQALPEGPNEAYRLRASALYKQSPSTEQRDAITALVAKFSVVKEGGKKAGAAKADWSWSPEQIKVAKELSEAATKVYRLARTMHAHQSQLLLQIDQREMPEPNVTGYHTVALKNYFPEQSPLEWVHLQHTLSQVASRSNELHVINFFAFDSPQPISVILSTHDHEGRADYLVHDTRAALRFEKGEVNTAYDSPPEHRVSYARFLEKIEAIKRADNVGDAAIAQVMSAIVRNPGKLPPYLVPSESLQTFTELVATWMLAESVRHRSAMISGMRELQLIASGQRTFAEALGNDDRGGTYPMSQGGSLKQGRTAEAHEDEFRQGTTPKTPPTKVLSKQTEQFSGDAAALMRALLDEYMPEVNRVKTLAEVEAALLGSH